MKHAPVIRVVTSQLKPEVEKEYVSWLHDTHIPMLLEFKRLKGVAAYKLASETSEYFEYMLMLEFDNQEGLEAYQTSPELVAAQKEAQTHDWRGLQSVKRRAQYKLVKSWGR